MTSHSDATRAELIRQAIAAAEARAEPERIQLPWRTSYVLAIVVEVPVSAILLNPRSHRIRAQLESSSARPIVEKEPFGLEAQSSIENLLREANEFAALKSNLQDSGQAEPGVVTATGMLVNANTRCVALRDLGREYIRLAVLPSDASQQEIDRLELRLQMKRDFRSEYTFTNELLFIEDLIKQHRYSHENIALEMGWASKSDSGALKAQTDQVKKCVRMLAVIRDVQAIADGRLPIIFFDAARQAILEIDDEVERLKHSDAQKAQQIREARLAALLSGAGYRELREISHDFVAKYLVPAMEDRPELAPFVDALTKTPVSTSNPKLEGLDVLLGDAELNPTDGRSAAPMLELLARSNGQASVVVQTAAGEQRTLPRSLLAEEIRKSVEGAAEDAKIARAVGDKLSRPIDLVRRSAKQVRAALEAYLDVKDLVEFDHRRMRVATQELQAAQVALGSAIEAEGKDE